MKLKRKYILEKSLIQEKHDKEWETFSISVLNDIKKILPKDKTYSLESLNKQFFFDPGLYKITHISHRGMHSVGGTFISWESVDLDTLLHITQLINNKDFIL